MTEFFAVGAIAVTASSVVAIGSWSWVRGRQARRALNGRTERGAGFSPDQYEPMARLTAADDLDFLRRSKCRKSGIVARWDRARRRVLRLYLKDLADDFRNLHAEARALVAESPEQYSDLVGVLIRQQAAFWRAMAGFRIRLALSRLGVGPADVRALVRSLEVMRQEIEHSVALASATA